METFLYLSAIIITAVAVAYLFLYISSKKNIKWFHSPSPEGKFADSHRKKIFFRIKGKEGAVVVVINAIGSSQAEWWPIQNEVGHKNRMITFDSSGYDRSVSENTEKNLSSVSEELNLILKFEKIRKPIYIVTNGTGSLYALQYAKTHPKNVLGILFVNPVPLRYSEWTKELNTIDECSDLLQTAHKKRVLASKGIFRIFSPFKGYKPDKRYKKYIIEHYSRTANYDTMVSELETLENTINDIKLSEGIPDIPVRILLPAGESLIRHWVKNGINEFSARQLQRAYDNLTKDYTKLLPDTILKEIPGVGEYIHLSKPEIIIEEIYQMIPKKEKKRSQGSKKIPS